MGCIPYGRAFWRCRKFKMIIWREYKICYEHMKIAKNIKIQSKYPEYREKI